MPEREFYDHDALCTKKDFTPLSVIGLKICLQCHSVFDKHGKGVAVTDKRFDYWRLDETLSNL